MEPVVYIGFPFVKETAADGFIYGVLTDHFDFECEEDESCTSGDGFVQAPDGSRAGVIREIEKEPSLSVCIEPEEDRWGVYNVGFVKPIKIMDDLLFNFRTVLPLIKEAYHNANTAKS